jgi:hypothetical protein
MKNTNQGSGLFPIIRRIRRPLLPIEPPGEGGGVANGATVESKPSTETASEMTKEKKADAEDSSE